jgi:eukaryotic-like serine/threonine-protein kinase
MSLIAGTRLGPYEIIASLGAGGMGEVHLANDTRLSRKVAIKLLLPRRTEDSVSRARFRSEAKAVSSLNHPHICTLYDVGEHNGRDYMVMEWLEGETITRRLERGPLPPAQILRHATEIAEALDHAHRHGIIHRDLKPANVMLTKAGAKLLDFGVAKWDETRTGLDAVATTTRDQPLTGENQVMGTLQYMAPEQLEGRPVDPRTDLFAFGALVHEMATGRKAFEASSQTALVAAILSADPPVISSLQPLSPPGLDRIVTKCLAKDPDLRWQTARDLADDLKWFAKDSQSTESARAINTLSTKTRGARRLMIGAAIVLAVATATTLLWFRLHSDDALQATNLRLISTFEGEHWGASFSPDGRFIAFLKEANGVPQVWVKNLAEGDPIQVTFGDVPARRLAWSPANDRIVFSRFRAGLWSAPALGGPARRLLEFGDAPKFSADGKRMVFARGNSIWTADADGGDVRQVLGVPTVGWPVDRSPALSPDGQTIAFFHGEVSPLVGDLWVIPAAGGTARKLTTDPSEGGWPSWTPGGRSIVYSSTRAGSLTLWQIPADGGTPTALTTGAGEDTDAVVSSDGATLLYGTQRKSWSLTLLDPASGHETEVLTRRTFIGGPRFSPLGDRLAFQQPAKLDVHLHVVSVDGRDARQITQGAGEQNLAAKWSGDATALYFYRLLPSKSFRKILVDGGTSSEVAPFDFFKEYDAEVDNQGRSMVYTRLEKGQPAVTLVRELTSGNEMRLGHVLRSPRWSGDSKTIFGFDVLPDPGGDPFNRWIVLKCPPDGQPCRELVRGFEAVPSGDGSRFFYLRDPGAALRTRELWTALSDGTNARKVGTIGPLPDVWNYDVSPTDNKIAYVRLNASRRELWAAQLK